ncbi:MAG: hypothetical protein KAJ62_09100 [Desulfobacteraceae bacterium]|nr:hypothetical protein [Desulfobacteraceae bacterium]
MEDEKLLLAEYEHFSASFWKNEEVGEKRVNFFITLTTAVIAGLIALSTNDHCTDLEIRQIVSVALSGLFLFGLVTFFRILKRNRVTDEYKDIIKYLREQLKERSITLSEYKIPFREKETKLFRGGLTDTVAVVNSFIIAVITSLWFGDKLGWIIVIASFSIIFYIQTSIGKKDREKTS